VETDEKIVCFQLGIATERVALLWRQCVEMTLFVTTCSLTQEVSQAFLLSLISLMSLACLSSLIT
jgi:hypothetical protein